MKQLCKPAIFSGSISANKSYLPISKFIFVFSLLFTFFFSSTNLSAQETEDDVVKVDSSIVILNATITETDGKSVTGLKKNQFRVFEDGKEQEINFFQAEE